MAITIGLGAQSAMANSLSTYYGTQTLVIYSGVTPTNAKTALSGNTALATHTLAGFTESNGVITANSIGSETIAVDGTATFARILVSGVSQWQGVVGTDVTVTPDANYVQNGTSNVTSLTLNVLDS